MKFKTLTEWINKEFEKSKLYDIEYRKKFSKETLHMHNIHCGAYNLINSFIESKNIDSISSTVKDKLVKIVNDYELYNTNDYTFRNLFIIIDALEFNYHLDRYYYKLNLPYEDKQKYNSKIRTIIKKYKKNKETIFLHTVTPKELLIYFTIKAREIFLNDFNYTSNYTQKRDKKAERNDLISEIVKIIVSTNYINDTKYKESINITQKNKDMFVTEYNNYMKHHNQTPYKIF